MTHDSFLAKVDSQKNSFSVVSFLRPWGLPLVDVGFFQVDAPTSWSKAHPEKKGGGGHPNSQPTNQQTNQPTQPTNQPTKPNRPTENPTTHQPKKPSIPRCRRSPPLGPDVRGPIRGNPRATGATLAAKRESSHTVKVGRPGYRLRMGFV